MTPPKPETLKRYGLTADDWLAILERQGGVCAVCAKEPSTGRLCVDHDHVKGWKKMPADRRKQYVRGLLCWFCNHAYVGRAITVEKSRRVTAYLEAYRSRQTSPE
jgi:hypothetical protein